LPQGSELHVLLVDDHPANRLLLERQLKFLGHTVQKAEDGHQAFSCTQNRPFDVLITDCNMPLMDGYELTRRVRADELEHGRPPCLIVGYTANAQEDERQRCLAVGMDDCLFKPVSLAMLRTCLSRLSQFSGNDSQAESSVAVQSLDEQEVKLFDLDMLLSLTEGDRDLVRLILGELYASNNIDLQQFEELLVAGRWAELGHLVHRIRGAARMVGARALIEAARNFEERVAKGWTDADLSARAIHVQTVAHELQDAVSSWLASQTS
jgi:two-component system sensor histidine kinase EvgS